MIWPLHHVSGEWQPPTQQETPRHDLKHKSKKAWFEAWRGLFDGIVCSTSRGREGDVEHDDDLPDPIPDPGSSPVTRVASAAELGRLELGKVEAAPEGAEPAVRGVVAVGE